jgi:hypothetical protein
LDSNLKGYNQTMNKKLLLGIWRHFLALPPKLWRKQVDHTAGGAAQGLTFMTPDHHSVRNLVVRELPRYARPIPPEWIAGQLDLPLKRVVSILDELEQHLTFLFRNPQGEVVWAYPVTVEKTPHRLTFSSGEKLYAA